MKFASLLFSVFVAIVITGCAHPIVISPDLSKIERDNSANPIQKNVGYYLMGGREKEVVTPGGGGDSVRYKPYKDIEAGFRTMLSNVFENVFVLKSDKDLEIRNNNVSYIVALDIATNSSSTGSFTWPPTIFNVTLNCNIKDATGNDVTSLTVVGDGRAEYDEFKSDFALSGKRASQDALIKMQHAFLSAPMLRDGASKSDVSTKNKTVQENDSQPSQIAAKPVAQQVIAPASEKKLKELKRLYDAGLISKEIYLEQQKTIFAAP